MTDLNDRLGAMLDGEPTAPYDMDRVVARGRRAMRRRNTMTAIAGTAGTAALTAAVVVPIAVSAPGKPHDAVTLLASPTPSTPVHATCKLYLEKRAAKAGRAHSPAVKRKLRKLFRHPVTDGPPIEKYPLEQGMTATSDCPPNAAVPPVPGKTPDLSPPTSPKLPPMNSRSR
jgi:hypothetical protein